jgi:hypothetical protein
MFLIIMHPGKLIREPFTDHLTTPFFSPWFILNSRFPFLISRHFPSDKVSPGMNIPHCMPGITGNVSRRNFGNCSPYRIIRRCYSPSENNRGLGFVVNHKTRKDLFVHESSFREHKYRGIYLLYKGAMHALGA